MEGLPHTAEGYNRAVSILKDRFGKEGEIVNAYMKKLLDLPRIPTPNARKMHEFFDKLSYCVQSLESLKQLRTVNGMASMTLEKLPAIRGDLVRSDPEWETWGFTKLTEALKRWTRQNPIKSAKEKPNQVFHTQQSEGKCRCVYCHASNHKPSEGTAVTSIEKRKRILTTKKLCFNCTGPYHRSADPPPVNTAKEGITC